jgi:uncharacterized flavoprotein (TIGR03862 family)
VSAPAPPKVAVVGGGPAGLMAAEVLSAAGVAVTVYERMPTLARRLLMAGRGGLNLTHSEPVAPFLERYGPAAPRLTPLIDAFSPAALVAWAEGLGQPTFTGSSGRIFPKAMKASPLLRAWIARLEAQGVRIVTRADWRGFTGDGALKINDEAVTADAVVLALGGASWPRLGSDGSWVEPLGAPIALLRPANSGFIVEWSPNFVERFAGAPLKTVALTFKGRTLRGEAMITRTGIEGGAVYALSAALRDAIDADGSAILAIDLSPDLTIEALTRKLDRPRGGQSTSSFLRKAANLSPLAINLLREAHGRDLPADLAAAIKHAPLRLTAVQPIARAISTAGGVLFDELDEHLMLKARPGVFLAGEMLDWEAPTGGYLLQASFATGVAAAKGVLAYVGGRKP